MSQEKNTSFRLFLKTAMRASNLTQVQLAEAADTTQATISRYIRGEGMPRAEELHRISKALGVSMEWLLTGESSECVAAAPSPSSSSKQAKAALAQIEAGLAKLRASLDA